MQVKVIEKYLLSEQYTPEKLMDMYKDSMLEELKNYSLMEYNLLRTAKMEFSGESHMTLTLENTIIAQTRSHKLVEFLEKIVCERCGLNLSVELAYEQPKESQYRKNSDLQIQYEIQNILKRVQIHQEDGEASGAALQEHLQEAGTAPQNSVIKGAKAAAKTAEYEKKTQEQPPKSAQRPAEGGKREFKRRFEGGYKRSDNPDVIYGRDFDDEAIAIEKIVGEMGEVTIRCRS